MNETLDNLSNGKEANWTQLSITDEDLYLKYAEMCEEPYCYENNWAFLVQESRYTAVRYWDGENLCTLVSKNASSEFVFLFVAPFNLRLILPKIQRIVRYIIHSTGKRVIVRKLPVYLAEQISTYSKNHLVEPDKFSFANEVPEDIFPQVIVSTLPIIQMDGHSWMRVRNHVSHFERQHTFRFMSLTSEHVKDAQLAISAWNSNKNLADGDSGLLGIDISAYRVFAENFAHRIDDQLYFAKLAYADNRPIGFQLAGRVSKEAAALYCNIVLTTTRGGAERCLKEFCVYLAKHGVQYLNLGGSEVQGLYKYKCKFQPIAYVKTVDIELGV